jgi:hypothetical protein
MNDDVLQMLGDLPERLAKAPFRPSKYYDPPHEYVMTDSYGPGMFLWHDLRIALVSHGVIRPFYKSKQVWKYLDLPDGYSYWVMAQWLTPDWRERFDPFDNYAINRQKTEVATAGVWTRG